jgi:hypothetical protein
LSQLKVADTNDAPDHAACIAFTLQRPQAMRSTGLMNFSAFAVVGSLVDLVQPVKSSPAGRTGTGVGARAPTAFVGLGWLLSGRRSMTGHPRTGAVPDRFISALIARDLTGAGWLDAQLHPYAPGALYRLYAALE